MVDEPFIDFKFPAAGATTLRTMPERLSDLPSAKDWGLYGDGRDDAAAFAALIAFVISKGCGTIDFEPGNYVFNSPLVVGHATETRGIRLVGVGSGACHFSTGGGYDGYSTPLISKGSGPNNDLLELVEGFTINGMIVGERNGVIVRMCEVRRVDLTRAVGARIQCCNSSNANSAYNRSDDASPGVTIDAIPYWIGSNSMVIDCRASIADVGICIAGYGSSAIAGSAENCNNVVRLGWAPLYSIFAATVSGSDIVSFPITRFPPLMIPGRGVSGTNIPGGAIILAADPVNKEITISANATGTGSITATFAQECPAIGGWVNGFESEACNNGIDLYNCQAISISGNVLTAGRGLTTDAPISALSWSSAGGGTVTVTTPSNHNLFNSFYGVPVVGGGGSVYVLQINTNVMNQIGNAAWLPNADSGVIHATRINNTQFSYTGIGSNPGAANSDGDGFKGYWSYPAATKFRIRKATECVIESQEPIGTSAVADFDLDCGGASLHRNNVLMGVRAANGFKLPTTTSNLAGWKFIGCSGSANPANSGTVGFPGGAMRFNDLPGGSNGALQPGPLPDQEFVIIDSAVNPVGNWGASVTSGGGAFNAKLRYNGSNWVISG